MSSLTDRTTAFRHPWLADPSLTALSFVLKNPQYWPKGFEWHYWNTSSCAMGLAYEFWGGKWIVYRFNIGHAITHRLFFGRQVSFWRHPWRWTFLSATPSDVANTIDKFLTNFSVDAVGKL